MTREQELEKMMKWANHCLWKVEYNFNTGLKELLYINTTRSISRSHGDSLEVCIRKAMQQEGEL